MKSKTTPSGNPEPAVIHVKNMVCNRCIRVVREELEKAGFDVRSVTLGEVVLTPPPDNIQSSAIAVLLQKNGFELVEDRRVRTIEQIKHAVIRFVRRDDPESHRGEKISGAIAREIGQPYHTLSTLFSSLENITIEQYVILQKIERVKELLKYGELTVSEIAWRLGYSSVQHLSAQFRRVTGMTPSSFKSLLTNSRIPIDNVVTARRSRRSPSPHPARRS